MITVMTTEVWTNDPPEIILKKIKWSTHLVTFGWFNTFKKDELTYPWIGEVDEKNLSFRIFRVTGPNNTSDFSLNGKYEFRAGKALVKVKHNVYFTSLVGLAGLFTCVYALWFLLQKKDILIGNVYLALGLILAGAGYLVSILRDLKKNDVAIRQLLERTWYENDTETDEGEEEEFE